MNYSPALYEEKFDGKLYANLYVSEDVKYPLKGYPEEFLHRMFSGDRVRGKDLLDFGCGPTVRCAISASAHVPELYMLDLLESNRKEVEKWVKKDPDAIDYTWQFKWVANLEKIRIKGKYLLDFGCGPTIRCAISASAHVPDLYLSDLLESNRKEVEKWVKKDLDAIDYTWQFKWVANLEGVSDYRLLEERTRKAIKEIIPCNFLLPNPLLPREMQFDIVTSSFCVDCVTDRTEYSQGLKTIASLVRPGGHLALISAINSKHYRVGNFDLPAGNVDPEAIKKALKNAGLKLLICEEVYPDADGFNVPAAFDGISCAIAKKI